MWEHYPLHYRFSGDDRYLIWSTHEPGEFADRVFSNNNSQLLSFDTLVDCQQFASARGMTLKLESNPVQHDFDAARTWAQTPISTSESCNNALVIWNLLDDACESLPNELVDLRLILERSRDVYERLFYGSSLPVITPEGKSYNPVWDDDDIADLRRVFGPGLDPFKNVVTKYRVA